MLVPSRKALFVYLLAMWLSFIISQSGQHVVEGRPCGRPRVVIFEGKFRDNEYEERSYSVAEADEPFCTLSGEDQKRS
jgi:hypothetical protein